MRIGGKIWGALIGGPAGLAIGAMIDGSRERRDKDIDELKKQIIKAEIEKDQKEWLKRVSETYQVKIEKN